MVPVSIFFHGIGVEVVPVSIIYFCGTHYIYDHIWVGAQNERGGSLFPSQRTIHMSAIVPTYPVIRLIHMFPIMLTESSSS